MPYLLYPRLPKLARDRLWLSIQKLPVNELTRLVESAKFTHKDAIFTPTGGSRVTVEQLKNLRNKVLDLAEQSGFSSGKVSTVFDRKVSRILLQEMNIFPAEASRDDVWSFLSMIVFPDIVKWRFPKSEESRYFGGASQRNTFQRLWWRAYTLYDEGSPDPFHLLDKINEDGLVGIMERPGISSNRKLAVTIGRFSAALENGSNVESRRRNAYRRIREIMPVLACDGLNDNEIEIHIKKIFNS